MSKFNKILLLCTAMLLLTACKIPIEYNALFVGDSLLAQATEHTATRLLINDNVGFAIVDNAVPGTTFSQNDSGAFYWPLRCDAIFAQHTIEGVVISLGINDMGKNLNDPANFRNYGQMLASATALMSHCGSNNRPIFWVLPHNLAREKFATVAPDVMMAIADAAAQFNNVHLIDFSTYVINRGYTLRDAVGPDDIHLTETGNLLFAQLVEELLIADATTRGLIKK